MTHRIDVHHHILPPDYVTWLRRHGVEAAGGRQLPDWSVELGLETMTAFDIHRAIVSISTPGVHLGNDADGRAIARDVNAYASQLQRDHPDRFGFFASVPLPDIDGAIDTATHALDHLGAAGVTLIANAHGTYVGDPAFDPLMEALNDRDALIFIHPGELPGDAVEGIPSFAMDFLLDTSRAAFNLVQHDVPRRFPRLKFLLSHAGGFVPYASHRMATALVATGSRDPFEALEDLRGFYYDTALSGSPAALPSLLSFADPGHVLYGSDWPFAPDIAVGYFTALLDQYAPDDPALHDAIDHGNALALLGSPAAPSAGSSAPVTAASSPGKFRRDLKRRFIKRVVARMGEAP